MIRKKQTLREELSRFKVLMEVISINEASVGIWDNIITLISKTADNLPGVKIKYQLLLDQLKNATDNDKAIAVIAKLAKYEEFSKIIIPKVMATLTDEYKIFVDELVKNGKNLLNSVDVNGNPRTIDDIIRHVDSMVEANVTTVFQGVRDVIKIDVIDAIKKIPKVVDNTTASGKLQGLFDEWDKIIPRGLSIKDKVLLSDGIWFRGLRAKINYIINNMYNTQLKIFGIGFDGKESASMNKILGLLKQIDGDKLSFERNPEILKAIDAEVEALRQSENFAKDEIYNVIESSLDEVLGRGRGYTIRQQLEKSDKLSKDYPSYYSYLMTESSFGKMLRFPGKDASSLLKPTPLMIYMGNFLQRALMFISINSTKKVQEIFDGYVRKYGVKKGIFMFAAYSKLIKSTIVPALYSIYDFLFYGAQTEEEGIGAGSRYTQFFLARFKEFGIVFEKDLEEVAKGNLDAEELSILKTLNPFTTFWDEIGQGLNWFEGGGFKRWVDATNARNQEIIDRRLREMEREIEAKRPELPQVIVPVTPPVINPVVPNTGGRRRPGT